MQTIDSIMKEIYLPSIKADFEKPLWLLQQIKSTLNATPWRKRPVRTVLPGAVRGLVWRVRFNLADFLRDNVVSRLEGNHDG